MLLISAEINNVPKAFQAEKFFDWEEIVPGVHAARRVPREISVSSAMIRRFTESRKGNVKPHVTPWPSRSSHREN